MRSKKKVGGNSGREATPRKRGAMAGTSGKASTGHCNGKVNQHNTTRPVDVVLSRLSCVRQVGPDRWMTCCPAHEDRDPSLSVHETRDGRVLIHCFAGCSNLEIVEVMGLQLADLFPARRFAPRSWQSRGRPMHGSDVLKVIVDELWIVSVGASMAARGELPPAECQRLVKAASRIREAAAHATDR